MTIGGWVVFIVLVFVGGVAGMFIIAETDNKALGVGIGLAIIIASFIGLRFYYTSTASGRRAMVDQRSELQNGLERAINVYTADGELIAHYEGKIDLEDNDGGYVIFDYKGKRYTYYNCFVESIAEIEAE